MLLLNLSALSQVPKLTRLFTSVSLVTEYLVFYFTYFLRALLDDAHLSDELLWKLMTNGSSLCYYYSNNKSNLKVAFSASVERNLLSKGKLGFL